MIAQVSGLISLPRLGADSALILAAMVALLAFIFGGRALLAFAALGRQAQAVRRTADGMQAREETLIESLARVRAQAKSLNVATERGLWALARFDGRVADAQQTLADDRRLLDELRHDGGQSMRGTVERIRGTLTFLRSASNLRRKFRA